MCCALHHRMAVVRANPVCDRDLLCQQNSLPYSRYIDHTVRVSGPSSKMAIQLKYPNLIQIMEPQIVSECLRFCIAELSRLFLPPETS